MISTPSRSSANARSITSIARNGTTLAARFDGGMRRGYSPPATPSNARGYGCCFLTLIWISWVKSPVAATPLSEIDAAFPLTSPERANPTGSASTRLRWKLPTKPESALTEIGVPSPIGNASSYAITTASTGSSPVWTMVRVTFVLNFFLGWINALDVWSQYFEVSVPRHVPPMFGAASEAALVGVGARSATTATSEQTPRKNRERATAMMD